MFGGVLRASVILPVLLLSAAGLTNPMAFGRSAARRTPAQRPTSVVETANFRIYGIGGLTYAAQLGRDFESLRGRLCRIWLGHGGSQAWSPKCEIVVHATAVGYAKATGQDRFVTLGASTIETERGRISRRRIDICAEQSGWFAAVVPHELTHVILADEFVANELPGWADEGMATLADTAAKQVLHQGDLEAGYRQGGVFRLAEFVSQTAYPSAERIPVFYGQSVSLVRFLVDRNSPAAFVRFLHAAKRAGYDRALSECYDIQNLAELERQWLTVLKASSTAHALAVSAAGEKEAQDTLMPPPTGDVVTGAT